MDLERGAKVSAPGVTVLVGIDAGASHTECVVGRDAERVLARWRGGPGAVRPGEEQEAARQFLGAITEILQQATISEPVGWVVVGAAGAGREEARTKVEQLLSDALDPGTGVHVTTDGVIALEAAFGEAPGIVVASGSGSIAYGRDATGQVWRVGGLGWRTGDEGSGYALGRAALSAVGQAIDGRGSATALTERLCGATGAESPDRLIQWAGGASTREIAALARAVVQTADDGDAVADALVEQAARDLTRHVEALLPRMHGVRRVRVALGGGLLSPESLVRHRLVAALQRDHADVELVTSRLDPAHGALGLAAKLNARSNASHTQQRSPR